MGESKARQNSRAAKGLTATDREKSPLQITLLGHDIVLSAMDLTIAEKQRVRSLEAELGEDADFVDCMTALASIFLQRADPALTWDVVKSQVTTRMVLDAIAAGKPPEADHPQ